MTFFNMKKSTIHKNLSNKHEAPIDQYKVKKEPYNMCRQFLPETYIHNGCIDIIKTEILWKNGYNKVIFII